MRAAVVTGAALFLLAVMIGAGPGAGPAQASLFADFSCSKGSTSNPCVTTGISGLVTETKTGSVVDVNSSGIAVWNSVEFSNASPFKLSFDTSAGTASMLGTGVWTGYNLFGSFAPSGVQIILGATPVITESTVLLSGGTWTLSPLAAVKLGGSTGVDSAAIGFPAVTLVSRTRSGPSTGSSAANQVNVGLTVVPEPGELALFGPGLFGLAVLLRRRETT